MNARVPPPGLLLLTVCLWVVVLHAALQPTDSPAASDVEASALLAAAQERLDTGDIEAAEKLLNAVLVIAPEKSKAWKDAENLLAAICVTANKAARESQELALAALLAGRFAEAECHLRRALVLIAPESQDRQKAEEILDTVLAIRRQMVQLDEIERLLEAHDYDTASTRLKELVPTVTDSRVLQRAAGLWERAHPNWWHLILGRLLTWLIDLAPYVVVILLLTLLLWLRWLWNRWQTNHWTLAEVVDSTGQGIGKLIASSLSHWSKQEPAAMTTGLLLLEASRIPLSPDFSLRDKHFDLAKELESLTLTVGAVNVGAVARLFSALNRWFTRGRQEIHGMAYFTEDKRLIAQLTARYCESKDGLIAEASNRHSCVCFRRRKTVDRIVTVTASADKSTDAAMTVAEEVTFKMLYTISRKELDAGERANQLRQGLDKLRAYVASTIPEQGGKPWESLEEAQKIFDDVRKAWPESLEAHLYEGIALDLLERHEEAIEHFRHVKEMTEGKDQEMMNQRAAYNEAIAHLRNLYQLKGIQRCIELVDELTGGTPDLKASPIKALALGVKADAIACWTLCWKTVPDEEFFDTSEITAGKSQEPNLRVARVTEVSIRKVTEITGRLKTLLEELSKPTDQAKSGAPGQTGWDADALRQLEWTIYNAEGDVHLYAATALAARDREAFGEKHRQYLDKGLSALRKCEMLLPPGVETLSNLGTLFLSRENPGDLSEARRYFRRVIDLNPNYEYAYYRLAQSWEKEHWREKVVEVLKMYPKPPMIPGFQSMYKEYYVQPKAEDFAPEVESPAVES